MVKEKKRIYKKDNAGGVAAAIGKEIKNFNERKKERSQWGAGGSTGEEENGLVGL